MLRYALIGMVFLSFTANAQNVSSPPLLPPHSIPMEPNCERPDLIGQHSEVLETMKFKNTIRILGPDTPATMDFSPSRTNFITDTKGIIRNIRCG